MVYERSIDIGSGTKLTINSGVQEGISLESAISTYYNFIMSNLNVILQSSEHETIVSTAKLVFLLHVNIITSITIFYFTVFLQSSMWYR